jgi:predicted TIM-barrel fold metal-dependent hydrolase
MILDTHVHLVGNGSSGSGCWHRPHGLTRLAQPFMLGDFGLPASALRGDLDRLYADRLLAHVRDSSLDAVVLLAQDEVYADDGRKMEGRGTFYVPNDHVLRLAAEHHEFLPAASIHPARPDALDELDRCLAAGVVALKLLPNCHNVECGLPRYVEFWRRMAAARLPLIAHTGGEGSVEEVRPELADPRNLRAPLEAGVTVIAAHCGTASQLIDHDYFDIFTAMLCEFPHLYGDISALNLPNRCRRLRDCLRPGVVERVVHGSDVPVPVFAAAPLLRGLIGVRDYWRLRRIKNPIERDYQIKRTMGFPKETFTRAASILRINRHEKPNLAPAATSRA